jgi:hypothetical protein
MGANAHCARAPLALPPHRDQVSPRSIGLTSIDPVFSLRRIACRGTLASRRVLDAPMLVIVNSGQTGVERGAHRAAVAAGLLVEGFMSLDKRDELGPVPADIAQSLTSYSERGPRRAMRASVGLSSAVVLVVPDAAMPEKFTAMNAVLQAIRSAHLPSLICDGNTNLDDVGRWTRYLATSGSTHIMVTGPRATRWPDGEVVARRLVSVMAMMADEGNRSVGCIAATVLAVRARR